MTNVLKTKIIVDILHAFVDITLAELKLEEKNEIFIHFYLRLSIGKGGL